MFERSAGHNFHFPVGDLSAEQRSSLASALADDGIPADWHGSALSVDMAFEPRVSRLIDEARGGRLAPPPGPVAPPAQQPSGQRFAPPAPPPAIPYQPSAAPGFGPTGPPSPIYPPPYSAYPAYGAQPGYTAWVPQPRTNSKAVLSLIFGIAPFVSGCLFPLGIAAIPVGNRARREIAASNGMETGEGLAKAGVILGWVMCGLVVAAAVFFLVLVITSNV